MGRPVVSLELMSKDPEEVSAFYEKIFDWKIQHTPGLNYRMVETGARAASTTALGGRRRHRGDGPDGRRFGAFRICD